MHLSRTFEIKGSEKFSVTPWPLLTSCSCTVMSCKPHPSTLNWGTKQPSQCPALPCPVGLSEPSAAQRTKRLKSFSSKWDWKAQPLPSIQCHFYRKGALSSCPSKFPRWTDNGIYHSKVILPKSTEAEQAPLCPQNVPGGFDRHRNQAGGSAGRKHCPEFKGKYVILPILKKAFSTIFHNHGLHGKRIHTVTSVFKKPTQQASGAREWKGWGNS